MHDDDGSMLRKNDIRTARKAGHVKSEAAPDRMEDRTDLAFRNRIPTADAGHVPTSAFARKLVHNQNDKNR
jgi:hypothetical protein